MTAISVCITVLLIAVLAARAIRDLAAAERSSRLHLADRQAAAAAATSQLADAVRALRLVADRLAPAPARVGKPATIHTRDQLTITGVILDELEDRTRLADARYVTSAGEQPVPGGVATILKANESWRQEHDG